MDGAEGPRLAPVRDPVRGQRPPAPPPEPWRPATSRPLGGACSGALGSMLGLVPAAAALRCLRPRSSGSQAAAPRKAGRRPPSRPPRVSHTAPGPGRGQQGCGRCAGPACRVPSADGGGTAVLVPGARSPPASWPPCSTAAGPVSPEPAGPAHPRRWQQWPRTPVRGVARGPSRATARVPGASLSPRRGLTGAFRHPHLRAVLGPACRPVPPGPAPPGSPARMKLGARGPCARPGGAHAPCRHGPAASLCPVGAGRGRQQPCPWGPAREQAQCPHPTWAGEGCL